MAVPIRKQDPVTVPPLMEENPTRLNARDRLLAAIKSIPKISSKEAEKINQAVQEARESSLGDPLPR